LLALIKENPATTGAQILQDLGITLDRIEELLIENLTKLKD
jgi:hypothetical protein